ncbi:hypothetical protein CBFG_01091 [Clostridiales bacterium 1_7_47FAA]|nr:hypothetical protein CBFG_01091 [Clostridiales bacterium 1_7_47FAA]
MCFCGAEDTGLILTAPKTLPFHPSPQGAFTYSPIHTRRFFMRHVSMPCGGGPDTALSHPQAGGFKTRRTQELLFCSRGLCRLFPFW